MLVSEVNQVTQAPSLDLWKSSMKLQISEETHRMSTDSERRSLLHLLTKKAVCTKWSWPHFTVWFKKETTSNRKSLGLGNRSLSTYNQRHPHRADYKKVIYPASLFLSPFVWYFQSIISFYFRHNGWIVFSLIPSLFIDITSRWSTGSFRSWWCFQVHWLHILMFLHLEKQPVSDICIRLLKEWSEEKMNLDRFWT